MTRAEHQAHIERESRRKAPSHWLTFVRQERPEPYAATSRAWRALNPTYPGGLLIAAAWVSGEVA